MEYVLYILGFFVIMLFLYLLFWRKAPFDAPMLGLLTLGLTPIAIVALKPGSMKFANVELSQMWTKTQQASDKAQLASDDAKLARAQSAEVMAFLLWNTGKAGFGGKFQEKVAKNILREIYGDKTEQLVRALQHRGVFMTNSEELKKIPVGRVPADIKSPLLAQWTNY